MKKLLSVLALTALLASTAGASALAHGHGHSSHRTTSKTRYPICTRANCNQTGRHAHDGVYYDCPARPAGRDCRRSPR